MPGSRARHQAVTNHPSAPGHQAQTPEEGEAGQGTRERIPAHLRKYVVEQSYAEYTAVDQAVWRFVLTQIYATLRHTAHPAYEQGLTETGISVERIPSIEAMDRCLRRFGWGAVCVDGFIPPRAFVEFQALGILPIAAEMRTLRHLVYTPAPDIIHEAAGHAPILPDPAYAAYLKRIGRTGALAFSSPEDEKVYRAIYRLSAIKEQPSATPEQVARAEREFNEAVEAVTRTTEAARMSRLYWWTAEYGLLGTPSDYKLYGAGLLSSLGESHSCHRKEVKKLPLSATCLEVSYDITREQPQLFVARDFEHLEEVLDQAGATLVAQRGGLPALREAELSSEVATLTLGDETRHCEVIGVVTDHRQSGPLLSIELLGSVGLVHKGRLARTLPSSSTGELRLLVVPDEGIEPPTPNSPFSFADGALTGTLRRALEDDASRPLLWFIEDGRFGDEPLPSPTLLARGRVLGARAGASDPAFYQGSLFPGRWVPEPRELGATERELLALYERAASLAGATWGSQAARVVGELHQRLRRDFPDEWLLRFQLLELLVRHAPESPSLGELTDELARLEVRFAHAEPIALGLRSLARLTDHPA